MHFDFSKAARIRIFPHWESLDENDEPVYAPIEEAALRQTAVATGENTYVVATSEQGEVWVEFTTMDRFRAVINALVEAPYGTSYRTVDVDSNQPLIGDHPTVGQMLADLNEKRRLEAAE